MAQDNLALEQSYEGGDLSLRDVGKQNDQNDFIKSKRARLNDYANGEQKVEGYREPISNDS